jgi:hypothetical protein
LVFDPVHRIAPPLDGRSILAVAVPKLQPWRHVAFLRHCCVLYFISWFLDLVFFLLVFFFLFRLLLALLPRLGILFLFLCFWKWIFFLLFLLVDTFDVLLPGTCSFLVVAVRSSARGTVV